MTDIPQDLQSFLMENTPQPLFPNVAQNSCSQAQQEFFDTTFSSVESMTNFINDNTELATTAANSLKVGSCSFIQGGETVKIPFASAGANFQASTGCESVALYMSMQQAITNTLTCTSTFISNNISNSLILVQQVVVNVSNANVKGNINIQGQGQSVNVNFQMLNFTSTNVQQTLSNNVKSTLNELQSNLQSTKNEAFSQPTSQKSLQSSMASTLNNIASLNIENIISNAINQVISVQGQTINVSSVIVGNNLNIDIPTQSQIVSGIIQSIQNNIMQNIFNSQVVNDLTSNQSGSQEQKNSGPDNGIDIFTSLIAIVAVIIISVFVVGLVPKKKGNQQNVCMPSILLIASKYSGAGLLVLGIVLLIWGILVKLFSKNNLWLSLGVVFIVIGFIIFIASFILINKKRLKCIK
jgi:hypothetical protein